MRSSELLRTSHAIVASVLAAGCGSRTLWLDDGTRSRGFGGAAEGGGSGVTGPSATVGPSTSAGRGGAGGEVFPPCVSSAECDDGDACTVDLCQRGSCGHLEVGTDDGDACTTDGCDPATGPTHTRVVFDDVDICTIDACDPAAGVTHTAVALDDGNACTVDGCDPVAGLSHEPLVCDTGDPCTAASCDPTRGCLPATSPTTFFEDFSSNAAGWTLGPQWQIGPAEGSPNCFLLGTDPATDHSPTTDNGLAGVVIGGCTGSNAHPDSCLESPVIDGSHFKGTVLLSFWRHLHSDTAPFMKNHVDVSSDGGENWVSVAPDLSPCCTPIADEQWSLETFDITAHKGAAMRVRICFQTTIGADNVAGWSVDDLAVYDPACFAPD